MLNHSHLPGVATGDLLRVTTSHLHDKSCLLFLALHEDPSMRPQLQVRVICLFTCSRKHNTTSDFTPEVGR